MIGEVTKEIIGIKPNVESRLTIDTYTGTWGLYPWGAGHDDNMVHPDDLDKAKQLPLWGRIFHCVGETHGYIILHLSDEDYRVKPVLYRPLSPLFKPGDYVQTNDALRRPGIVRALGWHSKRQEVIYVLDIAGKQSTKWYFADDLVGLP